MPVAPITHGSRMDHFYAVDTTNGMTYIGHCEQTAQAVGQLNLVRYLVVRTVDLLAKQQQENKEFGVVATSLYLQAHSKASTIAISAEHRVAIHILDNILKELSGG